LSVGEHSPLEVGMMRPGNKADTEDAMRLHIRERRAREVAEEFEQDLPARLRR
jgi:hypothetical protein